MIDQWDARTRQMSRRRFLTAAAATGTAAALGPTLWRQTWAVEVAPPADAHVAVGGDAAREMVVSWRTPGTAPVGNAQTFRYRPSGGSDWVDGVDGDIEERTVDGAASVYSHVQLSGLAPDQDYEYEVLHQGVPVLAHTIRTAPRPDDLTSFTFTAFGDQGVDAVKVPAVNDAVIAQQPAFHFHVGDLCYAYRVGIGAPAAPLEPAFDPIAAGQLDQRIWDTWLGLISRPRGGAGPVGAAAIPWMATIGNHEMEPTLGPMGYRGATGRMWFPPNGVPTAAGGGLLHDRDRVTYSFDYGNVRVIALDGNDANYEIPGNQGYLGARQDEWLAEQLAAARAPESSIDFIVVGCHQCSYCTNLLHGSDEGLRTRWDQLFRDYQVDLVINGHNHSYERAHPFHSDILDPAAQRLPSGSTVTPAAGPVYITAGASGNERVELSGYEAAMASYRTVEGGVRVPEVAHWSAARDLGPSSFIAVEVASSDDGSTMTIRAIRSGEADPFDTITIAR